ncbi:Heparanase-like protein 1 [Glycine max]|nr:Heparanase-like protein 1 [Glycine max]
MRFRIALFLFLASLQATLSQDIEHGSLLVDGAQTKAETGDNFICATIDWWPHDKCDYNHCPWGYSSVVNLDLSHPFLAKAIQALKPLRIRLGGSLQDRVLYDVGSLKSPCHPLQSVKGELFGFSKGCLHMKRWDELNQFFNETGAIVTFGLNLLHGKHQISHNVWEGAWDPTNAYNFIEYTISKGYKIDSWELGNELSGKGIGASVGVAQYGKDLIKLKQILSTLYENSNFKPSLVAPGGFYEKHWYDRLLQVSGSGIINVLTHHIYNLGPGSDEHLERKILDPERLSRVESIFSNLSETIQKYGPWCSAWVGEAGGAYNSGGNDINLEWHPATALNALLWHRLMGKKVLAVSSDVSSPFLRTYAHCAKDRAGVTLLLINLSNQTDFILTVRNPATASVVENEVATGTHKESSFFDKLKKTFSWVGTKGSEVTFREEYHLTPKDGYLRSQTMVLNGIPLELTDEGDLPRLDPVPNNLRSPIYMTPLSIAFVVYPNFDAPACATHRKL